MSCAPNRKAAILGGSAAVIAGSGRAFGHGFGWFSTVLALGLVVLAVIFLCTARVSSNKRPQ
jgi:hypothetical protein